MLGLGAQHPGMKLGRSQLLSAQAGAYVPMLHRAPYTPASLLLPPLAPCAPEETKACWHHGQLQEHRKQPLRAVDQEFGLYFLEFLASGPFSVFRSLEMAGGFTRGESQVLATDPFGYIFDDFGPDPLSETSTM